MGYNIRQMDLSRNRESNVEEGLCFRNNEKNTYEMLNTWPWTVVMKTNQANLISSANSAQKLTEGDC
jgi:hypothetical protein